MEWITEFPREEGYFWFYGYRYGRISVGRKADPELMLVRVKKTSNSFIYVAQGQFMFESEVEEPHFLRAELPELPEIN